MEELAEPATSTAVGPTDDHADASNAATTRLFGGTRSAPLLGSAFAFHYRVFDTVSLSWSELARRSWREVRRWPPLLGSGSRVADGNREIRGERK